jgi:chromosome segregation ATPase
MGYLALTQYSAQPLITSFFLGANEKFEQEITVLQQKLQSLSTSETNGSTSVTKESENQDSVTEDITATAEESAPLESKPADNNDVMVTLQNILNDELNELNTKIQTFVQSKNTGKEMPVNDEESQQGNSEDKDSEKAELEEISQENHGERSLEMHVNNEVQSVKDRLAEVLVPLLSSSTESRCCSLVVVISLGYQCLISTGSPNNWVHKMNFSNSIS